MSTARLIATGLALATLAAAPAAHATTTLTNGDCAWAGKSDPDTVNAAYPDQSATYWSTRYVAAPGSELRISGTFPHARYMSFHVYEGSAPIDHIADASIVAAGGINPFHAGADRTHPGTYVVRVVPDAKPQYPAQNTIYAGSGVNGEPVPVVTVMLRVYLGEGDETGGVGLPKVEHVQGDGPDATAQALPDCDSAPHASALGLNDAVAGESWPASWPAQPQGSPPAWGVARTGGGAVNAGPVTAHNVNPFFPNYDNTYLSLLVERNWGDVVAFRAKAPTFVHTRGARRFGRGQLRYWSFCTNELGTTRYFGCVPDQDAKIDARGYVTVVVSDPAHKPAHLDPQDNWLPWGPGPDTFILYRHMLPAPGFAQAAQRIPPGGDPKQTLGAYYPNTKFCSTATFDRDRCGLPVPAR